MSNSQGPISKGQVEIARPWTFHCLFLALRAGTPAVPEKYTRGNWKIAFQTLKLCGTKVPSIGQRIQMKYLRAEIIRVAVDHFETDDKRIEHALRVPHHADRIANKEAK